MIYMFKAIHYCQLMYLRTCEICLEIHEFDPEKLFSAPGLACQTALNKTEVKLDLLTDTNMLLMVEKDIQGGICHFIYQYKKANTNTKYIKDYDKNKKSSYLQYWDVKILSGCVMSQKLLVHNFEWIKVTSQFNEDFIKNYNEESCEGYFLVADVQQTEKLHDFIIIYHFYQKE